MSQPSYGPGHQPWGQPQGGPQQPWGQPSWGPPPSRPGSALQVPLLVLGLLAAVLGLLGAFLPTVEFEDGRGSFGPLSQGFGDGESVFVASGLVLLAGVGILVAGALLVRPRLALGAGLLVLGAGIVADRGLAQVFTLLQGLAQGGSGLGTLAVGGILIMLAGVAAAAVAVLAVLAVTRAARPRH